MRAEVFWVFLLPMACCGTTRGAELCDDAEEFRAKCEKLVREITITPKGSGALFQAENEFITKHLGSSNDEVRRIAARGVARVVLSNRQGRPNLYLRWLNAEHPPEVRTVALAAVLRWSRAPEVKQVFEELVCGDVTPPNIEIIALQWSRGNEGWSLEELVPEEKRALVARRAIESLGRMDEKKRWRLAKSLFDFDISTAQEAITSWYVTEPDAELRAVLFDRRVVARWKRWETYRERIGELGMKDWCSEVRALAAKVTW